MSSPEVTGSIKRVFEFMVHVRGGFHFFILARTLFVYKYASRYKKFGIYKIIRVGILNIYEFTCTYIIFIITPAYFEFLVFILLPRPWKNITQYSNSSELQIYVPEGSKHIVYLRVYNSYFFFLNFDQYILRKYHRLYGNKRVYHYSRRNTDFFSRHIHFKKGEKNLHILKFAKKSNTFSLYSPKFQRANFFFSKDFYICAPFCVQQRTSIQRKRLEYIQSFAST